MDPIIAAGEPPIAVRFAAKAYANLLLTGFAFVPVYLIAYLFFFQTPTLKFENHLLHELAIAVAILQGLFVTYVTWCCYRSSGEPLLRWLTLGFLAFALIYALHGVFTRLSHHHIALFLLYGPASRLVMAILLLIALFSYGHQPAPVEQRTKLGPWLSWIALFLLVDLAIAYVAYLPIASNRAIRILMEGAALLFSTLTAMTLLLRRIRSPLMVMFAIAVTSFALSSLAFILSTPWNHMWWLAHAIFAAGFALLSYGVVQAFHTTRSFSTIYSQEELMARIAEAMARTERALQELQLTNQKLEHLAATDPLTGVKNRRKLIEHVETEITRVKRGGAPFSLLSIDLDNFKSINDRYGHLVGDDVLKGFVQKCIDASRPYDGIARVGGEEFMVLLPQVTLETAGIIAERIRAAVASTSFRSGMTQLAAVTVSIGVSQFGRDGDTIDALLRVADKRLYDAKHQGRNRVIAV